MKRQKKKSNVYDTTSELYNDLLGTYCDEYNELSHQKRNKIDPKYKLEELFLKEIIIVCDQKVKRNQLIKKNL